ncbi:hypothetical protein LTR66_009487 [Elasticomyces elasticus]|nr:hypothetical protein LTR28_013778 [Elasticomyces elasticus]KAK4982084.1 hypothetical protein LTR66_009487 [Elasticomyces elasticus]
MATTRGTKLSKSDSMVLAQVFDPESAPSVTEILIDPYLPADRNIQDERLLSDLKAREVEVIRTIEDFEKGSRQDTKHDVYQEALTSITDLIDAHPNYASARNNRAQLIRWRYGDRQTICRPRASQSRESTDAILAALDDLRHAIELASPPRPQDAVSAAQCRLLGQAYTQLAAIYYAASKDLASSDDMIVACEQFENWGQNAFEEEGAKNFRLGGLYGNEVSKAMSVHTNPYAKLCGAMVKEAMKKEFAQA